MRWIPKYVYGSFWVRIGKFWELYVICWDCMYALKVVGFSFELLGHPVMAHLEG